MIKVSPARGAVSTRAEPTPDDGQSGKDRGPGGEREGDRNARHWSTSPAPGFVHPEHLR